MIPEFDINGNLLPGIHIAIWDEFVTRFGFNNHRMRLLSGLKTALYEFIGVGCSTFYLNGSFVTSKEYPNDYDCCWLSTGVNISDLDPVLLDFTSERKAQKLKYLGEFFPIQNKTNPKSMTFLDFFQMDNNGNPKGIVNLDLGSLS